LNTLENKSIREKVRNGKELIKILKRKNFFFNMINVNNNNGNDYIIKTKRRIIREILINCDKRPYQ